MYRVLVDVPNSAQKMCIFDERLIDQRVKVVDPVLELEDNASGSLEFTIYQTNQGYGTVDGELDDLLVVSSATLRVYQDSEEIWEGRPLSIDTDFYNGKKITCEGALSYLNDIDQPYQEYAGTDGKKLEIIDFIKGVLENYNAHASANRQFNVDGTYVNPIKIPTGYTYKGEVENYAHLPSSDVSDFDVYLAEDTGLYWSWYDSKWNDITSTVHLDLGYRRVTCGETTKEAIFAIVDDERYGGHIKVVTDSNGLRCLYYTLAIDPEEEFIGSSATLPAQDITFGKNLIDLTKRRDCTDFFTVLLPVGAEISAEHPKTIETMCLDVLNDPSAWEGHPLDISTSGTDLYARTTIPPYDADHVYSRLSNEYSRRIFTVDLDAGNGYDYYLFTSAYYKTDGQGQDGLYFYVLFDNSAKQGRIQSTAAMGYGETDETAVYDNQRIVNAKTLPKTAYVRQSVNGDKFQVPDTGSSTLSFAVAMDYAWGSDKSNPSLNRDILPDVEGYDFDTYRETKKIQYPKLFRAPYPRITPTASGLREVPASDIKWVGSLADPHWETSVDNLPYANNGSDDCDIVQVQNGSYIDDGAVRITISGDKSANYIDRYPPFGTPSHIGVGESLPTPWNEHYTGNSPDWMFMTGFFGHHVARVMVEPGKTYYLNTRVTNAGYPDLTVFQDDPEYTSGTDVPENKWVFNTDGSPKKIVYNDIFAYAVVARRALRSKNGRTQANQWQDEVISYKLANKSPIATELFMEKITIPEALFPERKASFTEQDPSQVYHLELWFACDSCYVNGTANLGNSSEGRISGDPCPTNGYRPSIYVDDNINPADEATQRDYRQCVTIAPRNSQPTGYTNFPKEYLVNKELADKYGVIIRRIDYDDVYDPDTLMMYAERAMTTMTGEPSFDVSALDLKECGLEDCDRLRLLQKIKIDTEVHGVDSKVALSQMSINLADRSSNTYTFGYEANKGISQM